MVSYVYEGGYTAGNLSAFYPVTATRCPWCSTQASNVFHTGPCPRVQAVEYYQNGTVKRVEFFEPDAGVQLELGSGLGL